MQGILEEIRQIIHGAAPDAIETISYKMPAFKLNGKDLIYFAAWKKHISMYPVPAGSDLSEQELSPYVSSKGTVSFQLDQPVPFKLIKQSHRRVSNKLKRNKKKTQVVATN